MVDREGLHSLRLGVGHHERGTRQAAIISVLREENQEEQPVTSGQKDRVAKDVRAWRHLRRPHRAHAQCPRRSL